MNSNNSEDNDLVLSSSLLEFLWKDAVNDRTIILTEDISRDSTYSLYYVLDKLIKDEVEKKTFKGRVDLNDLEPIHIIINNPGGDIVTAFAVCDLISSSPVPIHTHVAGCASSAAAFLAMCGHRRTATESSMIMLHGPFTFLGLANNGTIEQTKERLNLVIERAKILLKRNTLIPVTDMDKYLSVDLQWLSAHSAKELGIIDHVVEPFQENIIARQEAFKAIKAAQKPARKGKVTKNEKAK